MRRVSFTLAALALVSAAIGYRAWSSRVHSARSAGAPGSSTSPVPARLFAVLVPAERTTQPDPAAAAALWLATAGAADRDRLVSTLARVDEHVERSKNPLVEDLGDVTLREDAKAAYAQMGPGWTVVSALVRIGAADGACSGTTCARIVENCPSGLDCVPLAAALHDKRARLALWPLAGGATLACSDTSRIEDATARLRTRGSEKKSTIGWAFTHVRPTDNDVRGSAASLMASLQGLPDTAPPAWLLALSRAGTAPALPWLERLGPAFVAPKLSRWVERDAFLTEVRAEIEPLGCTVVPIATLVPIE